MWVWGRSRLLKMAPFESLGTVSIRIPQYYGCISYRFGNKKNHCAAVRMSCVTVRPGGSEFKSQQSSPLSAAHCRVLPLGQFNVMRAMKLS